VRNAPWGANGETRDGEARDAPPEENPIGRFCLPLTSVEAAPIASLHRTRGFGFVEVGLGARKPSAIQPAAQVLVVQIKQMIPIPGLSIAPRKRESRGTGLMFAVWCALLPA
jgi:hypothetical protein